MTCVLCAFLFGYAIAYWRTFLFERSSEWDGVASGYIKTWPMGRSAYKDL